MKLASTVWNPRAVRVTPGIAHRIEVARVCVGVEAEIEGVDFMDIETWNPNARKKSVLV